MVMNSSKKIDFLDFINIAFLLFCTISSVFPPLRTIGNNTFFCSIALFGWVVIALLQDFKYFNMVSWYKIAIFIFILYTFLMPYLFGNSVIGNRYLSILMFPLGYFIYNYYASRGKTNIIGIVIKLTIPFILFTAFKTIIGLLENPYLSRSIKSTGEYSDGLLSQGIGGYEFIYFLVLASIILFCVFINSSYRIRIRMICLSGFILSVFAIILSNYFTALLILSVGCVLALFLYGGYCKFKNILFVLLFFAIIMFIFFGEPIVTGLTDALIKIMPDGKNAIRLENMKDSLLHGLGNEFIFDRWPTLQSSIQTALQFPIFGLVSTVLSYSGSFIIGFGQHSHILDTFALFGIVIGVLNIYVLFRIFSKDKFIDKKKVLSVPMLIALILLLTLNNATPSIAFVAYLIYPYVLEKYN